MKANTRRYLGLFILVLVLFSPMQIFSKNIDEAIQQIRYSFVKPDGDHFWRFLNHDDSHWRLAKDASEIGIAVAKEKPSEVYVRIEVNHTPATLNNFYFKIKQVSNKAN